MKELFIELLNHVNVELNNKLITCELDEYVTKILLNATIISIVKNNKLQSFIAYYDNDEAKKNAYLSMIVTRRDARNLGLGKILINSMLDNLKGQKFESLGLEVLKTNDKALEIYIKYNFRIVDENDTHYKMIKKL